MSGPVRDRPLRVVRSSRVAGAPRSISPSGSTAASCTRRSRWRSCTIRRRLRTARLRAAGVPVEVVPSPPHAQLAPEQAEAIADRIDRAFEAAGVELVCLCGYLRKFRVGERWRGRAINIHPALLPDFGGAGFHGLHVHRAVLTAGRTETGCTVHWVDEEYDRGATILQRRCPVLPGDTPETLAARVFAEECEALPEAVARIASGAV